MSHSTVIRAESISKRFRLAGPGTTSRFSEVLEQAGKSLLKLPLRLFRSSHSAESHPQDLWALRDVSFDVQQGEVLGIIGGNGAGKSTLLKVISRIVHPTHGRLEIQGRVGTLLEVGTGFHPELSGRDNIYLNGAILGMSRREIAHKFDAIVDFAAIERFLDTQLKHYSNGMSVRLAFAVAAFLEPEVLIIDEVLAVGDVTFQKKCMAKMGEISQSGQTILFVSHNIGAITALTTRCLLLKQGSKVADGPTEQVVSQYLRELTPATDTTYDLRNAPRPHASGDQWRFTGIRLANAQASIDYLDDLVLQIDYQSKGRVEDVLVGVGIGNMDGTTVANVLSSEARFLLSCQAAEEGTLTIRIRQPRLSIGRYMVSLGALNQSSFMLDMVRDILSFEVVAESHSHPWLQTHSNVGVLLASTWSVAPNAEATQPDTNPSP